MKRPEDPLLHLWMLPIYFWSEATKSLWRSWRRAELEKLGLPPMGG